MADVDSKNPAELAADAATDVQRLAAILTHAGARPDAIAGLHQMVTVLNGIHQQLGSAPLPGQAPQPQPQQVPPGAPQAAPPGPPQAQAPQAPAPPPHQRAALHAASAHLQAAMASAKAARQQLPK